MKRSITSAPPGYKHRTIKCYRCGACDTRIATKHAFSEHVSQRKKHHPLTEQCSTRKECIPLDWPIINDPRTKRPVRLDVVCAQLGLRMETYVPPHIWKPPQQQALVPTSHAAHDDCASTKALCEVKPSSNGTLVVIQRQVHGVMVD